MNTTLPQDLRYRSRRTYRTASEQRQKDARRYCPAPAGDRSGLPAGRPAMTLFAAKRAALATAYGSNMFSAEELAQASQLLRVEGQEVAAMHCEWLLRARAGRLMQDLSQSVEI